MSVGETFFDELTAERLVTKRNKFGVPIKTWEQTKERNESLDAFVLALAALRIIAPSARRLEAYQTQLAAASARLAEGAAAAGHTPTRATSSPGGWLGPRRPGWLRGER